jgi:putative ABC transport system permease protein
MLKSYVKLAIKVLLRRKFFTFISLFGICFTLIVLMVVSALVDHVIKPPGPEHRSERFLLAHRMSLRSPDRRSSSSSSPGYRFLDRHVRTLQTPELVSIFSGDRKVVTFKDGKRILSSLKLTDGEYWQILDFQFLEGGSFTADDERNGNFVAVINRATRERFFGDELALGRSIEADGQTFRVVGVVENVSVLEDSAYSEIWAPIRTSKSSAYRHQMLGGFYGLMLARTPSDIPKIKAEFKAVLEHDVDFPDPKQYNWAMSCADTKIERIARGFLSDDEHFEASSGKLIVMVSGLALLFMLLPAVNLININVSRILERSSEIGIRKSFGASSRTLIGQFLVENLILTAIGGILGFAGAFVVLHTISGSGLIPYAEFHLNLRIFAYGVILILCFGVLSGVYPAWKMSRLHPVEALRGRA